MNDTLDDVEASPANLGLLEIPSAGDDDDDVGESFSHSLHSSPVHSTISEEDMAEAQAAVAAIPKRSSVVDIWRKRESPSKGDEDHANRVESSVSSSVPTATTTMVTDRLSRKHKEKEKKEDMSPPVPPTAALRNMWSQRAENSPIHLPKNNVVVFPSNTKKPAVALFKPPVVNDEPADLTITPAQEPSADEELEPRRSPVTNKWAKRGLSSVVVAASPSTNMNMNSTRPQQTLEPTDAVAVADIEEPPELPTPKRTSVVDMWKLRKSPQREPVTENSQPVTENSPMAARAAAFVLPAHSMAESDQQSVDLSITAVDSKLSESSFMPPPRRGKVTNMWSQRMNDLQSVPSSSSSVVAIPMVEVSVPEPAVEATVSAAAAVAAPSALASPSYAGGSPKRNNVTDRWGKRIGEQKQEAYLAQVQQRQDKSVVAETSLPEPVEVPQPVSKVLTTTKWPRPAEAREQDVGASMTPFTSVASTSSSVEQNSIPVVNVRRSKVAEKRWPLVATVQQTPPAAVKSRTTSVATSAPIRGRVAERWTKTIGESPFSNTLHSNSSDVEGSVGPPPLSTEDKGAEPVAPPIRMKVVDRWKPKPVISESSMAVVAPPIVIKKALKSKPVAVVAPSPFATAAADDQEKLPIKPSPVIQKWNHFGQSTTTKAPLPPAKPFKPPKKMELEKVTVPVDVDSDASSVTSKSDPAVLKKKNLMRMARKHVSEGLAHKLAGSGSIAKDDDDSSFGGGSVTSASSAGAGDDAAIVSSSDQKDAEEDKAAIDLKLAENEKTEPSPGKNVDANMLDVETTTTTVTSEDSEGIDDLTPRSKKYVERLLDKKKRLQAKRRMLKMSRSNDSNGEKSLQSASFNSVPSFNSYDSGSVQSALPVAASPRAKQAMGAAGLPRPERQDDLRPIAENTDHSAAAIRASKTQGGNENTAPSGYTPLSLHVSDSASASHQWLSPSQKHQVISPKSEAGQSEGAFSFYSGASGISRNSSGLSTSSLTSRAEKVLQERRRKTKEMSKDERLRAEKLARSAMNGPGPKDPAGQRLAGAGNYNYPALLQGQQGHQYSEGASEARARAKRAGLSTRYNTSSRFIDTDPSYGVVPEQGYGGVVDQSFSTVESVDSSEIRSLGSTTTASENDARRRRARKATNGRFRKDMELEPLPNGIFSEKFFSQSATEMEAFKTAYESMSIGQMAADLADEMSLSVKGTPLDLTKMSTEVNDSIRKYCGIKPTEDLPKCDDLVSPFDSEDTAADGETVATDDRKLNLSACAVLEEAIDSPTDSGIWDKPCPAPAGQPSFEEPASSSRQGVRAAYV